MNAPTLNIFAKSVNDETKAALFDLFRVHLTSEFSAGQLEHYIWRSPTPESLLDFTHERAKRADRANELLETAEELGMPDAVAIADAARFSETGELPHRLKLFTYPVESYLECTVYRWLYNHAVVAQSMQLYGGCYVPYESWAFRHTVEVNLETVPIQRKHTVRNVIQELFIESDKAELQSLLETWLPRFSEAFGKAGSANEKRYLDLGIKTYGNDVVREVFLQWVLEDVFELGMTMPAA